jgi:hypothetical protein
VYTITTDQKLIEAATAVIKLLMMGGKRPKNVEL